MTAWVLTVVPVLLVVMVLMVLTLPRLVGTAWASAGAQQDQMLAAFGDGDLVGALARALAMVVVVLPIVALRLRARPAGPPGRRRRAGAHRRASRCSAAWPA